MRTHGVEKLMVRLTPDEQRERGVDLARARSELAMLEDKRRDLAADIKDMKEMIENLGAAVLHCQEMRPVEVKYVPNLEADTMTTFRMDTYAIVSVRMLDGNERRELRQPALPMDGIEPSAPSAEEEPPETTTSSPDGADFDELHQPLHDETKEG